MYRYIRKEHREAIRSLNYCFYCQTPMEDVDIEHIIPLVSGGSSDVRNLTGSCSKCNSMKGSFSMDVFLQRIFVKRDKVLNSVYSYTKNLRRLRKGRGGLYSEAICISKITEARSTHSYYTNIINSIINKKYILHGE